MNDLHDGAPQQKNKSDELFQSLFRAAIQSSRQKIKASKTAEPIPLSATQQQMWFLHQLAPDSPVYNTFRAFYLTGQIDVSILKACLREIVKRHDVLRTVFKVTDGIPLQVVQSHLDYEFSFADLEDDGAVLMPATKAKEISSPLLVPSKIKELLKAEVRKTFDITQGPFLRVALFRLNENANFFVLVMPHIICDGWSLSIFFKELANLYEAFFAGLSSPLSALPVQFSDYALWQQDWLKSTALDSHIDYWRHHLDNFPQSLNLPVDYPRPVQRSYQGACEPVSLSGSLTEALKTLSDQEGVTLFMTLLAAFQTLLFRYSDQPDVVVGSPIAHRNHGEIQDLIGCFINTLALRTDLSGNPSFRQLLTRVKKMVLNAFAHQDLPFQELIEKLQVQRDLSFSPLFQVAFVLQNTPDLTLQFSGLNFTPVTIDNKTSKYDMSLILGETIAGLTGKIEYSTDLFKPDTIQRFIGHFKALLKGVIKNPECPVSQLPLLTESERNQLLIEWNDTGKNYPRDKCIHNLFEEQVEKTPEAIAIALEDNQLTYCELNQKANQLAYHLIESGVSPEVLVGICVESSLEMVIGILGILKSGGVYIPLDPTYPVERIEFILEDTQTSILLTQKHLIEKLASNSAHPIFLDSFWDECISPDVLSNPHTEVTSSNLAYIMYTSGSTGQPKGAMVSHGAVCNHMFWMQEAFPLTVTDRVLQKTPFSFDASVWEFYAPLFIGGSLVVTHSGGHKDISYLVRMISKHQITVLQVVPSLLRLLIDENTIGACKSLRRVFCGGEVLPTEIHNGFINKTDVNLINLYGPTEACIDATYWNSTGESQQHTISIGRPIANTQIYILDGWSQPVPVGVSGEIHIGGAGLARGYLNRPELTAGKFISNPFSDSLGARLYKTGDRGRYLPNGNIEFLGRVDYQVKIRGFRIEFGEIEATLKQFPAVSEVVVLAREDQPGNKQLVAYIILNQEATSTVKELKGFLKKKIPEHMIPSFFMIMTEFPQTPNGKIARRAFPPPIINKKEQENSLETPQAPFEKEIQQIWLEIFDLKVVDVHDDFFDLGGHSLLAMQLIAWLRRELQVELSIREIFDHPTIAGLAEIINSKG